MPNIEAMSSKSLRAVKMSNDWFTIGDMVETPYYSVKFNPDGSIDSLFDKELSREWVDGDFNKLKIYTDCPGNYDAWDILPNYKDKQIDIQVAEPLSLCESDGECASFKAVLKTEKSVWNVVIRLFRQSRGIEVENIVDWHENINLQRQSFRAMYSLERLFATLRQALSKEILTKIPLGSRLVLKPAITNGATLQKPTAALLLSMTANTV